MISVNNPKFQLGQTLATPGALEALEQAGQSFWTFLVRHAKGDWGIVDAEDAAEDDNGKREATTILLPEEY